MLPIAADIAVRLTREQAQSALPNAPVRPDSATRHPRRTVSRSRRILVTALRRLAVAAAAFADRIDRPVVAR
jgi:hypothetical protein